MPSSVAVTGRPAGVSPSTASTLDWLLHPHERARFFADHWERRPLVVRRGEPAYFERLFSLDEADRVLTTLDRRFPDIILKDARRDLDADDYTVDGERLDVARVTALFGEGATITMAFLDEVVPALADFCRGLEAEFNCPCQTNIYLTPPDAQGAKPHYDTHDVFVLQIAGSKHWTIFGTPVESPLAGQEFDAAQHALGDATLEFELRAGDVAYLPRGVGHEARSTDEVSLHITAGVLRYTWADLLLEAVAAACLRDAALRKSLPPGFAEPTFDRAAAGAHMRELWKRAGSQLDIDAAWDVFASQYAASRPPSWRGQLAQLEAARHLTPASTVSKRPGLSVRLLEEANSLRIETPWRTVTVPAHAAAAARSALSGDPHRVGALPGKLDEAGKLVLARRLIREGLLIVSGA